MITEPVYDTKQIRSIEEEIFTSTPSFVLMERAGRYIAELAIRLQQNDCKNVHLVAGSGNNGGDAYIAAKHLVDNNINVTLQSVANPNDLPKDAKKAYDAWLLCGGTTVDTFDDEGRYDVIIDGLFGIGLTRNIEGDLKNLVASINAHPASVISIDTPSGLNADTGEIMGCCIRADHTVTFLGYKIGLHTGLGPDHAGEIHFSNLNADRIAGPENTGYLIGKEVLRNTLQPRKPSSHKGTNGHAVIIGGAKGMTGAAILAGRAALNLGCGRVTLHLLGPSPSVDIQQPELMLTDNDDALDIDSVNCFAIGPGLGKSDAAKTLLERVTSKDAPLILDADALNIVAEERKIQKLIFDRSGSTLVTPHPREAARLLDTSTEEVQKNRVKSAIEISHMLNCDTVLKGTGSICAFNEGSWFINTSGNAGLASAGMGDILTGFIAAFICQGATTQSALLTSTHLHGLSADILVEEGVGPIGLTASEVIETARDIFNKIVTTT